MNKGEKIHLLNVSMARAILMDTCEKQGLLNNALKMEEQPLGIGITHHGKHRFIVRCKRIIEDKNWATLVVRCATGLANNLEMEKISEELQLGENVVIDCREALFFKQLAVKKPKSSIPYLQ